MKCSNCGKELKANVLFCGNCGTKVEAVPTEETVVNNVSDDCMNEPTITYAPEEAKEEQAQAPAEEEIDISEYQQEFTGDFSMDSPPAEEKKKKEKKEKKEKVKKEPKAPKTAREKNKLNKTTIIVIIVSAVLVIAAIAVSIILIKPWADSTPASADKDAAVTPKNDPQTSDTITAVPEPDPVPVELTLTFDAGDGAMDADFVTEYKIHTGDSYSDVLAAYPTASCEGFIFKGWEYTNEDEVYSLTEDDVRSGSFDFETDVTFTALWEVKPPEKPVVTEDIIVGSWTGKVRCDDVLYAMGYGVLDNFTSTALFNLTLVFEDGNFKATAKTNDIKNAMGTFTEEYESFIKNNVIAYIMAKENKTEAQAKKHLNGIPYFGSASTYAAKEVLLIEAAINAFCLTAENGVITLPEPQGKYEFKDGDIYLAGKKLSYEFDGDKTIDVITINVPYGEICEGRTFTKK